MKPQDQAERQQGEEQLPHSEQQLRLQSAALASAANAISITDREGTIQWVNPAFERLTGYRAEEVVGQNHRLLKTEEQDPVLYKQLWETISAGRVWHGQLLNRRKDGSLYTEEMTVAPVTDAQGTVTHFVSIKQDVTEQHRSLEGQRLLAQDLQQSEERLRLAVETAGLGTYIRDLRTNEVQLNSTCRDLLGVDQGPPEPEIAYRVLHPEDRPRVLAEVARAFDPAVRAICAAEFRLLRSDGSVRWVAGRGRVVFEEGEPARPARFLGILQDITERKLAEQELLRAKADLARANAELERRVQERTTRLREALTELEQMSYSMIHDMRAPLRAIHGFGTLLLADPQSHLSSQGQELAGKMISATGRMDQLVCDALEYAQVVSEERPVQPIDIGALATEIVQTYPSFQPPGTQVSVAPDLPWVMGNPASLTQCLSHLLDNAVKFAKPGQQPQIEVLAEPVTRGCVRVVVADDGIGIPSDARDKIFGMFERLSHAGEGTGIGLAIVKRAAERMGGRVGVESTPGKGSRFWLELRVAEPPLAAEIKAG